MKRWIKRIIVILITVGVVTGGVFRIIPAIRDHIKQQEKEKYRQEMRIMQSYQKANYAVFLSSGIAWDVESEGQYKELKPITDDYNEYGIDYSIYLSLKLYEKETGAVLPYETVVDYFSQEYEPDGSLRLYNNGLHPEMEAYIEWAWGRKDDVENYINEIRSIYLDYFNENESSGFERQIIHGLSPQMYDELAKKEADPDYEMDLLSLQQQGY